MAADEPNDTPAKPQDAPKDVQGHAEANAAASQKGMDDVHKDISGPASTEAKPAVDGKAAPAEATKTSDAKPAETTGDDSSSWLSDWACRAWSGAEHAVKNVYNSAKDGTSFLWNDITDPFQDVPDQPGVPSSDAKQTATATPTRSIESHDGSTTVNNKDLTASRGADGVDTVTNKHTGEVITRDKDHNITDKRADGVTKIGKDEVDTDEGGLHMRRWTKGHVPDDLSGMHNGEVWQDKDQIVYRGRFEDKDGGGYAIVKTDGTEILRGKDGDRLVISADHKTVDWKPKDGPEEHLTMDQWKEKYGKQEFVGYRFDTPGALRNIHDGTVLRAQPPAPAADGTTPAPAADGTKPAAAADGTTPPADAGKYTISLDSTNPNGGDQINLTVKPDGTSDLRHCDKDGKFLSDARINYNDPAHGFEQLDSLGNILSNYDWDTGDYTGDGFCFDDYGLTISDGDIFLGDNGTLTYDSAEGYDVTDNSLGGSSGGAYAYESVGDTGLSQEVLQDAKSQVAAIDGDPSAASVDQLIALQQLTGGKFNLSSLIERAEEREEREARRPEWIARKTEMREAKDQKDMFLDFAASDIYTAA